MTTQRLRHMVKQLREARELNQAALAKRARLSQGYVSKLEAGTQRNPSVAVLKRLAKALGVKPAALLE